MPNRMRTSSTHKSASTVLTSMLPADFIHQRRQDSPETAPRQGLAHPNRDSQPRG
jgi:hypothetical protein